MALPNIVTHNRRYDSTTTLKFGDKTLEKDVRLEIKDEEDGYILSDQNIYDYLSNMKTPYLLGIPRIVLPLANSTVSVDTILQISTFIPNDAYTAYPDEVEWQLSKTEDFAIKNWIGISNQGDITSYKPEILEIPSGFYFLRVRWRKYPFASPWSQAIRVHVVSTKTVTPTITTDDNQLTPTINISPYTLTDEQILKEGQDTVVKVIYTVTRLDQFYLANSLKIREMIGNPEWKPDYTITKLADDPTINQLTFPVKADDKREVTLASSTSYLVTVQQVGVKYSTGIIPFVFTTGEYKIKAPEFIMEQNGVNPKIKITGPFTVLEGTDLLDHHTVTISRITDTGYQILFMTSFTENVFVCPDLEPNKTYHISVTSTGQKYGESDPSSVNFTVNNIGIEQPLINITSRGLTPTFTLSPFKPINVSDTMRGTEWRLLNHANIEGDRLIQSWVKEDTDTYLQIPKAYLEPNTNYKIQVRYLGHKYNSPWSELAFKTLNINIYKPTITVFNQGLIITADISNYVVLGDKDNPISVIWNVYEVEYDIDPLTNLTTEREVRHVIVDKILPWDNKVLKINRDDGIKKNTTYKITGKIIGENYASPVSDGVYVTTPNISVKKPTINISGAPTEVPRFPQITTSAFETTADSDTHISTLYVIKTAAGAEVFRYLATDAEELTKYALLDFVLIPDTDYVLEVTHTGDLYGDSEVATLEFKTRIVFIEMPIDPDNNDIVVGTDDNNASPKYYGEFDYDSLNDTRNYLGNWNGVTEYKYDDQVLHEGILWYAQDTSTVVTTGTNLNLNREPGLPAANNVVYWKEDTRTTLPTYQWLLRQLGLTVDIVDNNASGVTHGSIKRGTVAGTKSNLSKFVLNSRVIYVYNTVEINNISYNDLAMYGLVGEGRTIRVGERLYWLRLMSRADHEALNEFRVTQDVNNLIHVEDNIDIWLGDKTDTEDTALVGGPGGSVYETDTRERSKGLRLVLEYISQYEEPWLIAKRQYPSLQYDRYTDTGYFGTIDNNYYNWHAAIGLLTGTPINNNVSHLAFYSHGKRLVVNRMPISYNVSFNTLLDLNVVFGPDIKTPGYVCTKINDFDDNEYNVRILRGGPTYLDLEEDIEKLPVGMLNSPANVARFSEWNELIYRVANQTPKNIDTNPLHGGYQIGSNWASLDNIGVGVFEHYSGNGCHDYVLTFVNQNQIASRGGTKLEAFFYVEKDVERNDHGVRLVLEDTRSFKI